MLRKKNAKRNRAETKRNKAVLVNPRLQIGSGQFVPKLSRVSLRFAAQSAVKTSSIDLIQVSGNNVYDPLGSTGSGSPPGFTYWAAMYERYRVIGSRCEITARWSTETKDASTLTTAGRVILFPSNNTTALASGATYSSQPYAKTKSFTTQTPAYLTSQMSSAQILGQKDVLGSDRLQSVINTGPADEWFWRVISVPDVDVSTNTQIMVSVAVTYDVEFFDRQPLERGNVLYYQELAYLANVQYILKEKKEREAARAAAEEKMSERLKLKLLALDEELEVVLRPPSPLQSPRVAQKEKVEQKVETKKSFVVKQVTAQSKV